MTGAAATAASFSSRFLTSANDAAPTRVGLIVDGTRVAPASASIVRDLVEASFVRIELVIIDAAGAPQPATPFPRFWAEGGLAYAAYAALDRRRTGVRDDSHRLEDIATLLADLPTVPVDDSNDQVAALPDELVERIRAASLDVVVHLGSRRLGGAILTASRHGVWLLRPGDGEWPAGDPAGLRELLDGSPTCSTALVRLAEDGADGADRAGSGGRWRGHVIDRATFATDPTSLARTRRTALYGSTHLVIRNLRLLHERGWDCLAALGPGPDAARAGSGPRAAAPYSLGVVRWFVRLALRRIGARIMRTVRRADNVLHWRVAIRVGHETQLFDRPDDLGGFGWLESPRGHSYADPFVVERDGRRWLFVEDFDYARDSATIACAALGSGGAIGVMREVLRTGGHLSYPLVVDDGGEVRMVPESAAEGLVRLYRGAAFPYGWTVLADLLPEAAVDTTIWRQDGRWWLFTTIAEPRGGAGMLMLYMADQLEGPWSAHPLNPISQDARANRGGGQIFVDGGRLIRPSQDGSRGYGYALTFNEIDVLTPTDYSERPVATVTPAPVPGLLGLHTYNRVGDVEVIDGKVARPRRDVA